MMPAWAIAITEDNLRGVIQSEAGRKYDLEHALQWLEENGEGWFVRDPSSPLDCSFFRPEVFREMYLFLDNDRTSLIRNIEQI